MLHELGHTWGLKHPWVTQDVWWDSVMNYAPKEYRVPVLWADDTNAALGTCRMPANAPAGTYHVGVVLRDAADAYQGNNTAW